MPAFNATIAISVPYPARAKFEDLSAAHAKATAIVKAALNGAMSETSEGDDIHIEATVPKEGQPPRKVAQGEAA